MNLTLKQLSYFQALAREGHFGRAAQMVHISQPALSVQIREMETALGQQLVERSSRRATLTPFGRVVLAHSERVLAEMRALQEAAQWQGGMSGRLSVGVIPTVAPYILPAALEALRSNDISLEIHVQEAKTERLVDALEGGQLDAVIMALPMGREGLREMFLFEDRFLLAGSAPRLAALGASAERLRPTELGRSELLLLEDGHCLSDQALEICGRGRGHSQIDMGASSLATLARLVAAGFGLTLMPELAAETERRAAPGMCLTRFGAPEPSRQIALVCRASTQDGGWFERLGDLLRIAGRDIVGATRQPHGGHAQKSSGAAVVE